MFTPYERRQLRLVEEWFDQNDPQLARALSAGPVKRPSAAPQTIAISLAVALTVLGLVTGSFPLILGAIVTAVVASRLIAYRRGKLPS